MKIYFKILALVSLVYFTSAYNVQAQQAIDIDPYVENAVFVDPNQSELVSINRLTQRHGNKFAFTYGVNGFEDLAYSPYHELRITLTRLEVSEGFGTSSITSNYWELSEVHELNPIQTELVFVMKPNTITPAGAPEYMSVGDISAMDSSGNYNMHISFILTVLSYDTDHENNSTISSIAWDVNFPFPLNLTSFEAEGQGCLASLNWITVGEEETSHFDVEVSTDGSKSFTKVGEVRASGNSSLERRYNFNHEMESGVEHYYRLKMVDIDGSFTYSQVRRVSSCSLDGNGIVVYPNPTTDRVRVSQLTSQHKQVILTNASGRELQVERLENGKSSVTFDLTRYAAGIYYINVFDESQLVETKKVIKQ